MYRAPKPKYGPDTNGFKHKFFSLLHNQFSKIISFKNSFIGLRTSEFDSGHTPKSYIFLRTFRDRQITGPSPFTQNVNRSQLKFILKSKFIIFTNFHILAFQLRTRIAHTNRGNAERGFLRPRNA